MPSSAAASHHHLHPHHQHQSIDTTAPALADADATAAAASSMPSSPASALMMSGAHRLIHDDDRKPVRTDSLAYRAVHYLCRIFPALFLYSLLGLSTLFIFTDPRTFFIISTVFVAYNLWKMVHVGYYSVVGIGLWKKAEQKDWQQEHNATRQQLLGQGVREGDLYQWNEVIHYVIVPNYKEFESILDETVQSLAQSALAKTQMVAVLAMEDREHGAAQKALDLINRHSSNFLDMMYTLHPRDLPGEIPGKCSNEAWALAQINQDAHRRGLNPSKVCVTVIDADSNVHPKHFECLNAKFCNDVKREHKIWQAPIVNYRNFTTVPGVTRLMSLAVSLHEISALANERDHHIPFSTYSATLTYFTSVGFDTDVVPEDWHIYIKGFFKTGGRAKMEELHLPVTCYAVECDSWWESIHQRFIQAKRHAWGITEIMYFLRQCADVYLWNRTPSVRKPNVLKTLQLFAKIGGIHLIAGASTYFLSVPGIVIFLYTWVPQLANTETAFYVLTRWSVLYQYLNVATVIAISLCLYSNYHVVSKVCGRDKATLFNNVKWMAEFALFGIPANLFMSTVPTFYAITKLVNTEEFVHIVAAKPDLKSSQSLARMAEEAERRTAAASSGAEEDV